ncbi:MAG: tRNA (adenosine(37)-N6)-threonylcarbamoyltransferase complex ATPase subunit type 1 TsaE [Ginsengibacter sp.]
MEISYHFDEIDQIAAEFLKQTKGFTIFAFSGELGAGKTTLISRICKQLGVAETVTSPTFSIIQEYATLGGNAIFHMDLYRIRTREEAVDAGIEDCLSGNQICLVEWPEKVPEIFPEKTIFTDIEILSKDQRKLVIHFPV